MNQMNLEKIKQVVEEFFKNTGLDVEVKIERPQGSTIPINLKMAEPQILIGERGYILSEVQFLLKAVLRKRVEGVESPFYINVDVNDYKKKKIEYLKEVAKNTADEVALSKREKYLPSMPPFERRVVHMELASRTDIVTESTGQEPERRIVIRAYP